MASSKIARVGACVAGLGALFLALYALDQADLGIPALAFVVLGAAATLVNRVRRDLRYHREQAAAERRDDFSRQSKDVAHRRLALILEMEQRREEMIADIEDRRAEILGEGFVLGLESVLSRSLDPTPDTAGVVRILPRRRADSGGAPGAAAIVD